MMMDNRLQKLYESKIKIYEQIVSEIKNIDYDLISEFEEELRKIENIDKIIRTDPNLLKYQILNIKL